MSSAGIEEKADHGKGEYVRGNVHTNTVEGWFALLKRGVTGTFHHVSEEHLDRYVDEFAFRYNNRDITDGKRATKAVKAIKSKRLYYKSPSQQEEPQNKALIVDLCITINKPL